MRLSDRILVEPALITRIVSEPGKLERERDINAWVKFIELCAASAPGITKFVVTKPL